MKNSVLERLLDTALACEEEDLNKLYQLVNPSTREEMGPVYVETLGYNPISYFDKREAEDYLNILMLDAPQSIRQYMQANKDSIIASVIDHKENMSHDYLITLLNLEIAKVTGWRNKKYPLLNLEEEFIELDEDDDDVLDSIEDDEDYDDDDSDFSDDDIFDDDDEDD